MANVTTTLSNISRVPENRGCLRQAGVQDALKFYSNLDDDVFKLEALLITAHVVDSLDCDPLGNSTGDDFNFPSHLHCSILEEKPGFDFITP